MDIVNFFKNIKDVYHKSIDNSPIKQLNTYDDVFDEDGEEVEIGLGDLDIKI